MRLLQQLCEPTVVDALLEPWCLGEEAGQISFISTLKDTAGDIRQAFVVEDDETCQVMLEMLELASILKEVPEDIRVSAHQGSGRHDGKLHEVFTLSPRGWDRA